MMPLRERRRETARLEIEKLEGELARMDAIIEDNLSAIERYRKGVLPKVTPRPEAPAPQRIIR